MRILHLARTDTAGIPGTFVRTHNRLGHYARLATFYKHRFDYPSDICFKYPALGPAFVRLLRALRYYSMSDELTKFGEEGQHDRIRPLSRFLIQCNELMRLVFLQYYSRRYRLFDFDIYHLESGVGFLRDGRYIRELKSRGKKMVAYYHGSDLRARGANPAIDKYIDLHLTGHYDLLSYHRDMEYLPLPLETEKYVPASHDEGKRVRICHCPSHRALKGTEKIITTVENLQNRYPVELVLVENKPHQEALEIMRHCDIMIDQIEIGTYGVSAMEALAFALPTCVFLKEKVESFIPDHPFVNVTSDHLEDKLIALMENPQLSKQKGTQGREWVVRTHDAVRVVKNLYAKYQERGWIDERYNFIG